MYTRTGGLRLYPLHAVLQPDAGESGEVGGTRQMILEFQKVYEAMQKLFLLLEEDLKKWVREALREEVSLLLETRLAMQANQADGFLTRKEAAQFLRISLVTLHDWMNRGRHFSFKLDRNQEVDWKSGILQDDLICL